MKHILFKSMLLCLLTTYCMVPAAESGAAARALSSSSPAPAKMAALAQVQRLREAIDAVQRYSGDDGKGEAEFRGAGAAAAAGGVAPRPSDKQERKLTATDLVMLGISKEEIFQLAVSKDDTVMLGSLIEDHGFDVNSSRVKGTRSGILVNPLHSAALLDAAGTIQLLVEKRADVNARLDVERRDLRGYTPYSFAFLFEKHKALRALFKVGAAKIVGSEDQLAGMEEGDRRWLAHMLSIKPTVFRTHYDENAVDEEVIQEIDFPTMLRTGNGGVLSLLVMLRRRDEIQKLADANRISQDEIMRRDGAGRNPWLWAATVGNLDVMKVFMARGNALPLHIPTWKDKVRKQFNIKKVPKRLFFDPYCKDENGNDALAIAQSRGYPHVVNFFYDYHASRRAEIIAAWQKIHPAMIPAVANITGEYCYGPRAIIPVASAIEFCETPKVVGGGAAAAAARFESPKVES